MDLLPGLAGQQIRNYKKEIINPIANFIASLPGE
jgi:hypothetical protein